MTFAVYLPILLAAVFGLVGPPVSRRLPPGLGTWLLSAGGLVAAACCGGSLLLLAGTWLGQLPALASAGGWSVGVLRHASPVRVPIAVLAGATAAVILGRVALVGGHRVRALRAGHRLAAALGSRGGELAVLDSGTLEAMAVPGRPGRIVATTGLLRALPPDQRRALLAHERAHLSGHHHLHQSAAALAATNPLLARLPQAVALSCERWADEKAARASDRATVAAALATAGGPGAAVRATPAVVLGAVGSGVTDRIEALRGPAPRAVPWRIAVVAAVLVAAALAVGEALRDADALFDLAHAAYRVR